MVLVLGLLLLIIIAIVLSLQNNQKKTEGVLKLTYTLLIAVFIAMFAGVGIAAFYPSPRLLDVPAFLKYCMRENFQSFTVNSDLNYEAELFEKKQKDHKKKIEIYNSNVSIIAIISAVILIIISLTSFKKILLIADGLLLGGIFVLLYGVLRGIEAQDNISRFIMVAAGLLISLILGYTKLIKPQRN